MPRGGLGNDVIRDKIKKEIDELREKPNAKTRQSEASIDQPATEPPPNFGKDDISKVIPHPLTKQKVLGVYDAEIEANLKHYKSRDDMVVRIRKVLDGL